MRYSEQAEALLCQLPILPFGEQLVSLMPVCMTSRRGKVPLAKLAISPRAHSALPGRFSSQEHGPILQTLALPKVSAEQTFRRAWGFPFSVAPHRERGALLLLLGRSLQLILPTSCSSQALDKVSRFLSDHRSEIS